MRPVRARGAAGFSLLEVLVAFTILALALAVLFRIFSGGLRSVGLSGQYNLAVLHAESRLAAAGIDEPLEVGERAGEWEDGYRWRQRVEEYRPEEEVEAPKGPVSRVRALHVTVDVSWGEDERVRRVSLGTLRLVPRERTQLRRRGQR